MFAWTHARYEARSDDEHEALLQACEARDLRRACTLTRRHIEAAAAAVERLLPMED
jgi:DNA-binding GntR family transcriptional regulator